MAKKKFGNKRYFLNPKDGVAAASFDVEASYNLKPDKDRWPSLDVEGTLSLSDCNRQIRLEFDVWTSDSKTESLKTLKDRRKKLERLKNIVLQFVDSANAAYDFLENKLDEYHRVRNIVKDKKKK